MRRLILIIMGFSSTLLTHCESPIISNKAYDKIICAAPDGESELYDYYDENNKIVSAESYEFRDLLSAFENNFKKSKRKKILVYVFGGMNEVDESVVHSEKLIQYIMDDSDYYPMMLNWESSLFESYMDHLVFIRKGVRSPVLGPTLLPFYFLHDLGRSLIRLPSNMIYQSFALVQEEYSLLSPSAYSALEKSDINWYIGEDNTPSGTDWYLTFMAVIGFPCRLFTTSIIDPIGSRGWQVMTHRARHSFEKNFTIDGRVQASTEGDELKMYGVFSHAFNKLARIQRLNPDVEITIIGHSMGTLIINEALTTYANKLNIKNIVYMASASSAYETSTVLNPYLKSHPKTIFYNLCIHPRRDKDEYADTCVLPTGSVLTWIDRIFTEPISLADYRVGRWAVSVECLPALMLDVDDQIVIKAFGVQDPLTNVSILNMPENHTDFSEPVLRFWRPEFWQIPNRSDSKILIKK